MPAVDRSLRVGTFLAVAVALLFVVVFLLGQKQSLFHRKVHLRASFANTAGLVVGTSVRLAGVDVGVVERIAFDPDLRARKVHVVLGISSAYQERVRADSVAHLASKGLLGDMVIDVDVGSADARQLVSGDEIASQESQGLNEVVRAAEDAIGEIRTLTRTVNTHLESLLNPQVTADFGRTMHSIADISDEAAHGRGAVHALLHDPALGDDLRAIGSSGRRVATEAARAVGRVDALLAQDGVQKLPADLSRAAADLSDVLAQVKGGHGLAHTVVYERDDTKLMPSLAAFARTLQHVSEDVDAGKGTVGALLKDPTVYQDLKLLLGNMRRSRILRTLVRYTISHDGLRAGAAP